MLPIECCEIETVEIKMPGNIRRVTGHRFGDFAAHRGILPGTHHDWRITHLPSGLRVASGFLAADTACEAMIEIARLRNDWAVFGPDDATPEVEKQIAPIVQRFFGYVPKGAADGKWGRRLNGYEAAFD